jgi:hypothetical protein
MNPSDRASEENAGDVNPLFIVAGVVLIVSGIATLIFSRQLDEALMRRRPPPPANRAEHLRPI